MKVYLVTHGDHDDYEVDGVFSSQERADEFTGESQFKKLMDSNPGATPISVRGHQLNYPPRFDYEVQEIEMDSAKPLKWMIKRGLVLGDDGESVPGVMIVPREGK